MKSKKQHRNNIITLYYLIDKGSMTPHYLNIKNYCENVYELREMVCLNNDIKCTFFFVIYICLVGPKK